MLRRSRGIMRAGTYLCTAAFIAGCGDDEGGKNSATEHVRTDGRGARTAVPVTPASREIASARYVTRANAICGDLLTDARLPTASCRGR
jgi:hypothetical protein